MDGGNCVDKRQAGEEGKEENCAGMSGYTSFLCRTSTKNTRTHPVSVRLNVAGEEFQPSLFSNSLGKV